MCEDEVQREDSTKGLGGLNSQGKILARMGKGYNLRWDGRKDAMSSNL